MLVLPLPNYFWVQQIWSHFLGILCAFEKEKWIDMDWLQEHRPQTPNHGLYHQKSETEGSCTAFGSIFVTLLQPIKLGFRTQGANC